MDINFEIKKIADKERAKNLSRFFKTGKGDYGEGDKFLGIAVPQLRGLCKKYWKEISFDETQRLIYSEFHEKRLLGLFILIERFKHSSEIEHTNIFNFYLKCAKENKINNWDLVDLSAPNLVGRYLIDKDKSILYSLAKSSNLWERRISVLATFYFIKEKKFDDSLKIAEILLEDKHDLIHKAVGWMLREIGKRDLKVEEAFLKKHYKKMPRTMLRYSIERFEEGKRLRYLNGEI